MLRSQCSKSIRAILPRQSNISALYSTANISHHSPNAPLDLDPSFRALLKDVDISLLRQKSRQQQDSPGLPRELEVYPNDPQSSDGYLSPADLDSQDGTDDRGSRKSPAALFGSSRVGAVIIPLELQRAISQIIAGANKPLLHADAKRLFLEGEDEDEWDLAYDTRYKSRRQASRHAERDGTAFASVALPAHYSAIYAVLDHLKQRLGSQWKIERVIDWGCGTGSGLWASVHSFQNQSNDVNQGPEDLLMSQSAITTYLGIDKREGLVAIGKRLLKNSEPGAVSVTWQKSFKEENKIQRSGAGDVLALSAFMLSSLPSPVARKALVKEIWDSGADTMVLIDHSTTAGFECIAEARDFLLRMGKRELEDPETESWDVKGSHIVAPCPHDAACPLYHPGSSKLVCGFSQRLQRPEFVRKTKHSGIGHEDTAYSYVVVRRGLRPTQIETKVGRIGQVGKRELEKLAQAEIPLMELLIDGEHHQTDALEVIPDDGSALDHAESRFTNNAVEVADRHHQVEATLRQEAYGWPRLVFPPLKRSGHVILDSCTPEGKIMRITIPKSQGKQPFYDARKSSWGDIFPHEPKNMPQERYQPIRAKREGGTTPMKGKDIGKRGTNNNDNDKISYAKLSKGVREHKINMRRNRIRNAKDNWVD